MSQNKEATQFLSRVSSLPKGPVSLDEVLQPSLQDEAELRKLFATDKGNARLRDIRVGLVDIFAAPSDIRTTRARIIKDDADLDTHHVMALPNCLRRKEGSPAMVENLEAFKKNWAIFTEGSLSQLPDWSNVIAAGGSVQACLRPLPKSAAGSKRAMRKYFHDKAFPSSDVDLFLYGLTVDEVCCACSSCFIFLSTRNCLRPNARLLLYSKQFVTPSLGMSLASEQNIQSPFIVSTTVLIRCSTLTFFQPNIRTETFRSFFASTVPLPRFSQVSMSTRRVVLTMGIVSGRIRVLLYQ